MRNFLAKSDSLTIFEGTLFSGGEVIIVAMPPALVTMMFPSMDKAEKTLSDYRIEWLDQPNFWGWPN